MHPAIGYHLATALTTERHHQAERERAAAAIRARRTPQRGHRHPSPRRNAAALTRHVLGLLRAPSA
jgi:hypothetical protein